MFREPKPAWMPQLKSLITCLKFVGIRARELGDDPATAQPAERGLSDVPELKSVFFDAFGANS
jgi:hypothetical protein